MRCTWIYAIWLRGSLTGKIRNNYAGERISDTRDEYAAAELRECDLYAFRPDGRGGEIADKIAKWRRKGVCRLDMDHLVFNTGDLQEVEGYKSELMKEVGDCAWFIAGIADCFGFTLEEVMQQNLDKLASRRERGVIDGNGDNR